MINVRPFEQEDLNLIDLQSAQEIEKDVVLPPCNSIFTVCAADKIILILGFFPVDERRCVLSTLVSKHAGPYFKGLKRVIDRLLSLYEYERLECSVKSDFEAGARCAKLFGFTKEGTMRKFFKGTDYDLYGRIK